MEGIHGRILSVDLTTQTFLIENPSEAVYRDALGGKGLGSFLLFQHNPAGIDPFDPENRLIFAAGPVTGSGIWGSSRYGVFTKSPQTGLFAESYAGGINDHKVEGCFEDSTGKPDVAIRALRKPVFQEKVDYLFGLDSSGVAKTVVSSIPQMKTPLIITHAATPDFMHWGFSARPVLMTILGGSGIFFGPLLGAALFFGLEQVIIHFTENWMIFLGLILIPVVLFFPRGIPGTLVTWIRKKRETAP